MTRAAGVHALLVHGMGRTPASMLLLAARLRRLGFRPHLFGYSATLERFATIAARLTRRLQTFGDGPLVGVGYSLGGLLLRAATAGLSPTDRRPDRLVMLGTPNHSPRLARSLKRHRLYRLVHGDCGQLLGDEDRMAALPFPAVPTTLIAGTAGWYGRRSPFGDEPNDGVVSISEVGWDGIEPIRLPLPHTVLMNGRAVPRIVAAGRVSVGR